MTEDNHDLRKILRSGRILEERVCMYEVDSLKAMRKLAGKQLPDPLDAVRELLANAIDAYGNQKENVRIDFTVDAEGFSITDYGSGMDDQRLRALRTLGSSDKRNQDLIGRFGIGFASLFHRDMKVKSVVVDTQDKMHKQLVFEVKEAEKNITLEEYLINEETEHGTNIKVSFKNKNRSLARKIKDKIVGYTRYLPHAITLNGKRIRQPKEFSKKKYKDAIDIDAEEVTGFLALRQDHPNPRIIILSRNLPVGSYKIETLAPGAKQIASRGNVVGIVNYDKLNLVASRNEVLQDSEWYKLLGILKNSLDKFYSAIFNEYKKELTSERRNYLLKIIESLDLSFLDAYRDSEEEFQATYKDDSLQTEIIHCPLFPLWHDPSFYSLADLKKIWTAQGKNFLMANDEGDLDFLLEREYEGKILRTSSGGNEEVESALCNIYRAAFKPHQIDGLEEDKRMQEELKKFGIIDSRTFSRTYDYINDSEVNENTLGFVTEVRRLLNSEPVKALLRKHDINDTIEVRLAKINKTRITATYHAGKITLNLNSPEMQVYLQGNPVRSAQVFLPILGHEVSHDQESGHGNPFYNLKNILTKELREVVAKGMIEREANISYRVPLFG